MPNNKQFEIPGAVRIDSGNGGLTKIDITTPMASAEIYLHGAHVTRYESENQPVLFMSKSSWFEAGKPIRGGVPICFPWFGPNKNDPKLPAHGFARLREWSIESVSRSDNGEVTVTLSLKSDGETRALWPFDFVARYEVVVGEALEMKLQIQNTSNATFQFEEALHTYLTVGDIKQVEIEGLQGVEYLDKVDGAKAKQQSDPQIHFTGETDRPYLGTETTCIVHDQAMKRQIEVAKKGSHATVVWNPWINKAKAMPDFGDDEWPGMVCVETANVAPFTIELAAGGMHEMTAQVRLVNSMSRR